ncbi:ABC transporter ATP-binding protein [Streptomyces xantholiticus]|uniref:ABC transporter ATP-binding protein n=1 Tax=Streptomyces xantholiticus TaxID=68285 RepID=UPI00167A7056|nr:ABC transporter ATP-binding protein [Streptomyces xantholiticus]GGW54174.1 ABC transporter ATP-binding protein [Streptomyces xantholiticus]
MTATAIEANGLGLGYGRRGHRALDGCSFRVPAGRVCALAGPNGAGKSSLLALAAGLLRPTGGTLRVLDGIPSDARGSTSRAEGLRGRIAYVAQDKPLYPQLTIGETLRLGHELNRGRWDAALAERIVEEGGGLDPAARIRSLSGGQRTRVALALALAKRPELMLLDEPMADLDPLARHRLTAALMTEAADHGTTIVISSHILSELEATCDYVLLLDGGRVRLAGETEDLISAHTLLTGPVADLPDHTVVESRTTGRQLTALVRGSSAVGGGWQTAQPSLEELLMAHLRSPDAPPMLTPSAEVATA